MNLDENLTGFAGESIPPTSDGYPKFNYEVSFTNNQFHEESDQAISVPPTRKAQTAWSDEVPHQLKQEIQRVVRHTFGTHTSDLKVEDYRMC